MNIFTFDRFKSTLRHLEVFFISVVEKSLLHLPILWACALTCELQFFFKFYISSSSFYSLMFPLGHLSITDSLFRPRNAQNHTFPTSIIRTLGSVPLLSVLKRLDCSHKITKLRAECLLPSVVKNLFGGLIIYEKGNNCRKRHTIYVSLQCLQEHLLQNRVQFISSPWAIYRRVTANVKVIKTQSEPNPGSFVGSLYISGKLPTHPSPKSTLISSHLGPSVGLGEG